MANLKNRRKLTILKKTNFLILSIIWWSIQLLKLTKLGMSTICQTMSYSLNWQNLKIFESFLDQPSIKVKTGKKLYKNGHRLISRSVSSISQTLNRLFDGICNSAIHRATVGDPQGRTKHNYEYESIYIQSNSVITNSQGPI